MRSPDGSLAKDGEYNITFRIYNALISGNKLHEELIPDVAVRDGQFSVVLGDTKSFSSTVFAASPRYLGIAVNGEPEMIPRQQIRPVPWPLMADNAHFAELANKATNAIHADVAAVANTLRSTGTIPGQPTFQNISFQGLCFGCGQTAAFAKNTGNSVLQKGIGVSLQGYEFNDFQQGPFPKVVAGGSYGFVIGRADIQEIDVNGVKMKSLIATSEDAKPGDYVGIQTKSPQLARVCSPYPTEGPYNQYYNTVLSITANAPVVMQPTTGCVIATVVLNYCPTPDSCSTGYLERPELLWMLSRSSTAISNPDPITGLVWIQ